MNRRRFIAGLACSASAAALTGVALATSHSFAWTASMEGQRGVANHWFVVHPDHTDMLVPVENYANANITHGEVGRVENVRLIWSEPA